MHNIEWHKPSIYHAVKIAEKLEVHKPYAINARRRYLMQELELVEREIAFYQDYEGELSSEVLSMLWCNELQLKRLDILKELQTIKRILTVKEDITDDMIDNARSYPIDKLIEFTRGKAVAFCHEDKNPSMYHATRTNRANCPVCDKKFDPIGVLMERDGMSFKDAVKHLN